ncbi:hypothetical protein JCM30237_14260 [Halolamina litorea]|uniref:Uncharacterized protein n=1 Tax=Halolamina litorea TaxID=1515593 RepID=A0ABD6BPW3_9EURY|nr:hypothetical protein [Halolamina litorea]
MQWTDDAADDWEEAGANPPHVDRESVEMTWTDDGFVLAPDGIEDTEEKRANALFSTVACKVGNDTADRDFGPQRERSGSPEAEN